MASQLEKPRDIVSGVLVLATGAGFLYFGSGLTVGTAGRMGPGYFPMMLSGLMILLGIAIVVNALRAQDGESHALTVPWRALVLVLGAVVFFALTLKGLGLFVSLALCILATAKASSYTKWPASIALAVVLSLVCVLVFVYALGLPIPVIGQWLTLAYWWPSASPTP
jgi:lysylphosphatidylglycerol synthetase-like protein (DUF2156 family)